MANWTASLDKLPTFEAPNAVAYVTFACEDGRKDAGVRWPYNGDEAVLLRSLAQECANRSARDARDSAIKAQIAASTLVPGSLTLPDISAELVAESDRQAQDAKISAALRNIEIRTAAVEDPTIVVPVDVRA